MDIIASEFKRPENKVNIYDLGDCFFNTAHGEIHSKHSDDYVHLEKKVAEVFHCLVSAQGDVVTREEIFDSVWPNLIVSDDSLNRCISVLRKKLKAFNHHLSIKTHPKVGFHLNYEKATPAPVEFPLTNQEVIGRSKAAEPTNTEPLGQQRSFPKHWPIFLLIIMLIMACSIIITWNVIYSNNETNSRPVTSLNANRVVIMPFSLNHALQEKYPTIETKFRQLIANHPALSTIAVNELTQMSALFSREISRSFNARYVIRSQGVIEAERDILQWQIIDGLNGDIVFDGRLNLALNNTDINSRILASEFIERTIKIHLAGDKAAQMKAIITSAQYLFIAQSASSFQRPAINMLANSITSIDPKSTKGLKALAKILSQDVMSMQKLTHPYSNLAINSLTTAIKLTPQDLELYQLLARLQIAKYQWFQARETLSNINNFPASSTPLNEIHLLELVHQTGLLSTELISRYQSLYQKDPLNIKFGLALASLYIHTQQPVQALKITDNLIIKDSQWQVKAALIGSTYLRFGDKEKGKQLFFLGYENLGVPKSYIDALYQGIHYPAYQQQASDFLTQAANQGIFNQSVLLSMYAELGDVDRFFILAFQLADSFQFRLTAALEAHSAKIRQHPQFIPLMKKIGLVAYWQQYGFPHFCRVDKEISCR